MLAQIFSERGLLIVVTVIGMAMCTMGIGQVAARGEWAHPLAIVAYVIGLLILIIAVAVVFNIPLPLIDSARAALIAIVVLAIAKIVLTQVHRAFAG
jgi:hypothetical protein